MALCLTVYQILLSRVRHECVAKDTQTQHTFPYTCTTTGFTLPRQVDTLRYMVSWHVLTQTYEYEQSHLSNTHIHAHMPRNVRPYPHSENLTLEPMTPRCLTFHNEEILNRHWCNRIICIYIPLKGAPATPPKTGQS